MTKYIDKEALIEEIEKRIKSINSCPFRTAELGSEKLNEGQLNAYNLMLSFINTLEVKEVDLEKALSDLDKDIKEFVTTEEFERESETCGHYWTIAKHAFLLGLKTQKGE